MSEVLQVIGIGDLHFDGPLKKHLTQVSLHDFIVDEVRTVLRYAKRNGIKHVIFYGDICHYPSMSVESTLALLALLQEFHSLKFIVMTGNHDVEKIGEHSLRLLKHISQSWMDNVRVIDIPTLVKIKGSRFNILPWPHKETVEDACNVIHIEVDKAKWDTGRPVASKVIIPKNHFCVAGHIHTAQIVSTNVHYSGTLYQTKFGEGLEKYFHLIEWDQERCEGKAKLIPHKPLVTLHNVVIKNKADVKTIPDDPNKLCKIFVHSGVDVDHETLSTLPNVVKMNTFKTKNELQMLIEEDLVIDDESDEVRFDTEELLTRWLSENKVTKDLSERALLRFKNLTRREKAA